ncbi:MAG: DUF1428 domain-containing protein [Bdellovibrionaceae bacterium]|nr:DUF1428 domain-containing protein [Pseudobdellovibrionaceae bacterium]
MPKFVDGFVIPIPKKNVKAYQKIARASKALWLKHGALDYQECVGTDIHVNFGLPFPKLTKLKAGETLLFAWITYKSKAHRDRVNAKVEKDPHLSKIAPDPKSPPFNSKRMSAGGFTVIA